MKKLDVVRRPTDSYFRLINIKNHCPVKIELNYSVSYFNTSASSIIVTCSINKYHQKHSYKFQRHHFIQPIRQSNMFLPLQVHLQGILISGFHRASLLSVTFINLTSLVVWWSELLTTNHEVPGSIPGSTMGIFPCRERIPVVTMVWVVSRIRFKVETSVTRSHNSINSD